MMVLAPFSWIFMILIWCRNLLFDHGFFKAKRLPGFVISIGNIAVGGTGKSPLAIDFCRRIIASGGTPAIVTRGYRSGLTGAEWQVLKNGRVIMGTSRPRVQADEARMQSLALMDVPVIVGARRHQAVQKFLTEYKGKKISHWILEDGFQHRSIFRDVDVVVLDARTPSGFLIPAGFFREPASSLARANIAVLTKAENDIQVQAAKGLLHRLAPKCDVLMAALDAQAPVCRHGSRDAIEPVQSSRWAMIASISRPEDFAASLGKQGIIPVETFIYQDHCSINLDEIISAKDRFDLVITTEKDWARDEAKFRAVGLPIYVLPLSVRWQVGPPSNGLFGATGG